MATQIVQRVTQNLVPVVAMKPSLQASADAALKEEVNVTGRMITLVRTAEGHSPPCTNGDVSQQIRLLTVQVPPAQTTNTGSPTNASPSSSTPEFCVDPARAVYPGLHLGATFSSYQELTNLVSKFQMAKGVHLYVRSSRKLYPVLNQMGEVIRECNQDLMFAEVYYACTRGGRRFIRRANGNKELRNCPFNIKLRLTRDGQRLYIRDICPAHNHVLERGIVPRPVTHAPLNYEEMSQRSRSKIMKPPSILSRPPIIQTLVRGEVIKDTTGATRQVILSLPGGAPLKGATLAQKPVPITLSQANSPAPTVAGISVSSASTPYLVAVPMIRGVIPATTMKTPLETAEKNGDSAFQLRIKEEPREGDPSIVSGYNDDSSSCTADSGPVIKAEATAEDVEQSLFEADAECVNESNEKIVPDDGESVCGDPTDELGPDHDPDEDQGSDLAKRPRMTLDLPCSDDRFVLSRQNVLDTMKFCCECGTRVSERYYSDKPDRLGVTLVCEEGHTVDWQFQKIIRKKIPYQMRLPGRLLSSSNQRAPLGGGGGHSNELRK